MTKSNSAQLLISISYTKLMNLSTLTTSPNMIISLEVITIMMFIPKLNTHTKIDTIVDKVITSTNQLDTASLLTTTLPTSMRETTT